MGKEIFRKVSMERLSSPEQLDVLMKVTSPLGWLALLALGVLVLAALLWGWFGSIATTVGCEGILIKSGGVLNVASPTSGQVTAVYVNAGDTVAKGQLLARISQPKLLTAINADKAQLRQMQDEYDRASHFSTSNLQETLANYATRRVDYRQSIQLKREQLKWLKEKLANQEKLLAKGLIRKQDYLSTQKDIFDLNEAVKTIQLNLKQLDLDESEFKQNQEMDLLTKKQQIDKLQMQIQNESDEYEGKTRVTSPYTGSVVAVIAQEGSLINAGDNLLTLELTGEGVKNLMASLYVAAEEGKRVQPGMRVHIAPSTVKKEEWGTMLGIVTSVAQYPASQKVMLRELQNQQLVESFSAHGAPIGVQADLIPDPHTPSGYKWSSPKGPPISIEQGTLCTAWIDVATQRPISLVIPFFKKHVLGIGLSQ